MFIAKVPEIGSLAKPLSGLVLHYGEAGASAHPCEAASIGSSTIAGVTPPKIKVFVSPSSLDRMKALYAPLGKNVTVLPLLLTEAELDAAEGRSSTLNALVNEARTELAPPARDWSRVEARLLQDLPAPAPIRMQSKDNAETPLRGPAY